jgi:hypothetical protein
METEGAGCLAAMLADYGDSDSGDADADCDLEHADRAPASGGAGAGADEREGEGKPETIQRCSNVTSPLCWHAQLAAIRRAAESTDGAAAVSAAVQLSCVRDAFEGAVSKWEARDAAARAARGFASGAASCAAGQPSADDGNAVYATEAQPAREVVAEVLRALTRLLGEGSAQAFLRYLAAAALKQALMFLACAHPCTAALGEAQACCMRLVRLLLPCPCAAGPADYGEDLPSAGAEQHDAGVRGGIWCGGVLEELLRTIKAKAAAEAGACHDECRGYAAGRRGRGAARLRALIAGAGAALPGALCGYVTCRMPRWRQTRGASQRGEPRALGVAERDAAALGLSILHRFIACQALTPPEHPLGEEGGRGEASMQQGEGDEVGIEWDGWPVAQIFSVALWCLGGCEEGKGEVEGKGEEEVREGEGGRGGEEFGSGRGNRLGGDGGDGWGCLRRKCASVLLSSDLSSLSLSDLRRLTWALEQGLMRCDLAAFAAGPVFDARSARKAHAQCLVLFLTSIRLQLSRLGGVTRASNTAYGGTRGAGGKRTVLREGEREGGRKRPREQGIADRGGGGEWCGGGLEDGMEREWVIPALRSLHVLLLRRAAEAWPMEGGGSEQGGASVVLCRMTEEWDDVLFKVPTCVSPCMLRV